MRIQITKTFLKRIIKSLVEVAQEAYVEHQTYSNPKNEKQWERCMVRADKLIKELVLLLEKQEKAKKEG